MRRKAVIFGAGEWGSLAYHYYKPYCDIIYYLDNDEKLWGTFINGIEICSPIMLKKACFSVIIANKRYEEEIKKQLYIEYGIKEAVIFRLDEHFEELYFGECDENIPDELIVAFTAGLGNQMFQYALYKNYEKLGKNVKADLSAYINPHIRSFELQKIFRECKIKTCNPENKKKYLDQNDIGRKNGDEPLIYIEPYIDQNYVVALNKKILNMNKGYVQGYHQTYYYPDNVRNELLNEFVFPIKVDRKLGELTKYFSAKKMVSVHIRRGDYLQRQFQRMYGGICTPDYYKKAMELIQQKIPNAVFCFFSDEIEWVKKSLKIDSFNVMYVEKEMFDSYEDWYDLYLMSICKHNIIANSTFSWWGAWLNQYPGKIVVAPEKWLNMNTMQDICPPEWIRI